MSQKTKKETKQEKFANLAYVLGENLRRIRLARKCNQVQFGEILGMTQSTISDLEKARVSCTLETLMKIANTLEISVVELLH